MNDEKAKMLKLTTDQIESKFGQGLHHEARRGRQGAQHRRASPRERCRSTPRSASAACRGAASSRCTAPSRAARRRSPCRSSPRPRRMGGIVAFIDAEHALDPVYAARLGVDIDEVLISQPDTGEQALEICDMLVRSGAIDAVVVDSVAALVPRAEIEGEIGDTTRGPAGAPHVAGPAQAGGLALQVEHHVHLHQPAAREDRRHVRQPRDHHGRPRPQVLLQRAHRHPPHRLASRRTARSWATACAPRS